MTPFTPDELALVELREQGFSVAAAAIRLGWNASKADAIRKSIARKRAAGAELPITPPYTGTSRAVWIQERIAGKLVFSPATIASTHVFLEEMHRARSRATRVFSELPRIYPVSGRIIHMHQIMDLQQQLRGEQVKLERLRASRHAAEMAIGELDQRLATAKKEHERAADKEALQAALDDQEIPKPTFPDAVLLLETQLQDAIHKESVFARAERKQGEQIEALTADISGKRHDLFLSEIRDTRRALHQLIAELTAKALELSEAAGRHGLDGHTLAADFYAPADVVNDPLRGLEDRALTIGVLNAALRLGDYRQRQPGMAEVAAEDLAAFLAA